MQWESSSLVQERNPISKDEIYTVYRRANLGEISSREFWEDVGLGYKYPEIETVYLDSRSDLDAGFVPVARSLSKKYGIGLLSNDISKWSAYLRNSDVYCRNQILFQMGVLPLSNNLKIQ